MKCNANSALKLLLVLALSGCANDRYLTSEEDTAMRKACEQGCVTIPLPLWEQVRRLLGIQDI